MNFKPFLQVWFYPSYLLLYNDLATNWSNSVTSGSQPVWLKVQDRLGKYIAQVGPALHLTNLECRTDLDNVFSKSALPSKSWLPIIAEWWNVFVLLFKKPYQAISMPRVPKESVFQPLFFNLTCQKTRKIRCRADLENTLSKSVLHSKLVKWSAGPTWAMYFSSRPCTLSQTGWLPEVTLLDCPPSRPCTPS